MSSINLEELRTAEVNTTRIMETTIHPAFKRLQNVMRQNEYREEINPQCYSRMHHRHNRS